MLYIRDETLGITYTFNTDSAGYAAARNQILMISEAGHVVGDEDSGSINKVFGFFGGRI